MSPRVVAAITITEVVYQKKSLAQLSANLSQLTPKDKALAQELIYGVIRWFFQIDYIVKQLLPKPIKKKDAIVHALILVGVYQLLFTRVPDYAAISETVNAARNVKKEWATKLINGLLRNLIRKKSLLLEDIKNNKEALYAHPSWMIKNLSNSWPLLWEQILEANNQHPPLCLRVNSRKISRIEYIDCLRKQNIAAEIIAETQNGIILEKAIDITMLPGYHEGLFSVQDGAAQLAAELLQPLPDDRILDACAAPGGKTCHILEIQPHLKEVIAVDNDSERLEKLRSNLQRLDLTATVICHDVGDLKWWDGHLFDRILLDVPCSATGTIRRHPDIKLLRHLEDIPTLASQQYQLLCDLWQTLKPGGILLYVTCSIFPEENVQVIQRFLKEHEDCQEIKIEKIWGQDALIGKQILPGMNFALDGFYYAQLKKE